MTGGYNGWKDSDGEWRFSITILPEGNKPGEMIFGFKSENGSEPDSRGLAETEFRQMMAERYGHTPSQVEKAVRDCKDMNA